MSDTLVFHDGPLDGVVWVTVRPRPVEHIHLATGDVTYHDTHVLSPELWHIYEWEPA